VFFIIANRKVFIYMWAFKIPCLSGRGRILTALSPAKIVSIKALCLSTDQKLFARKGDFFSSKIFHTYSGLHIKAGFQIPIVYKSHIKISTNMST
jgi:hypothetical protein